MLKKSNHIKRLVQPLPHFAAHICKMVDHDVEVSILKKQHTAQKGTVKRMKLTAANEDKEMSKEMMELAKIEVRKFPDLEIKKGWVQIKAEDK